MGSLLALVAIGAVAVLPGGGRASFFRCSLIPYPVERDSATTFFVGRAQPDTQVVSSGISGASRRQAGEGSRSTRRAFGQVIRVEQLGGSRTASIEAAFARLGAREVVIVPWDYDPACDPVPWTSRTRWNDEAGTGLYRVTIRAESNWVGGRPVGDAFAANMQPYPRGMVSYGYRDTYSLQRGRSLTPEEYFELFAALPERYAAARDPAAAGAALDAWERAHADLARKYPAPDVLRYARLALKRQ